MNLVREIVKYRSSDSEWESIGGHEPPKVVRNRLYTDEQVERALELLSINSLPDLARQDFRTFGKKQSWVQLARPRPPRLVLNIKATISALCPEQVEQAGFSAVPS